MLYNFKNIYVKTIFYCVSKFKYNIIKPVTNKAVSKYSNHKIGAIYISKSILEAYVAKKTVKSEYAPYTLHCCMSLLVEL